MDLGVRFDDFNQYCYEVLRKHMSILQFYFSGTTDPVLREAYKAVMHNIVDQQKVLVLQAAEDQAVYKPHVGWIDEQHQRINNM